MTAPSSQSLPSGLTRGAGFFLLRSSLVPIRHLPLGAVHDGAVHQANDTTSGRVHRQRRVEEQARIDAIPSGAEARLAGGVGGEVQLSGILDGQDMPSSDAPAGLPASVDHHLLCTHPAVGQECAELAGLAAILCQPVQAHRPVVLHRGHQGRSDPLQTGVAEPAETVGLHANRTPWLPRERIDSEFETPGKTPQPAPTPRHAT